MSITDTVVASTVLAVWAGMIVCIFNCVEGLVTVGAVTLTTRAL